VDGIDDDKAFYLDLLGAAIDGSERVPMRQLEEELLSIPLKVEEWGLSIPVLDDKAGEWIERLGEAFSAPAVQKRLERYAQQWATDADEESARPSR
jgi:hypothetical protein